MNEQNQHQPVHSLDQFMVRFPPGMRELVKGAAATSRRTMTAEIIYRLETTFLVDEAKMTFGDLAAAQLAVARTATTGEGLGNSRPVAAGNRQGASTPSHTTHG